MASVAPSSGRVNSLLHKMSPCRCILWGSDCQQEIISILGRDGNTFVFLSSESIAKILYLYVYKYYYLVPDLKYIKVLAIHTKLPFFLFSSYYNENVWLHISPFLWISIKSTNCSFYDVHSNHFICTSIVAVSWTIRLILRYYTM